MSYLSDLEIKASVLSFLEKKGRWGAKYFPLDTLVRWLGRKIKRDGKRVKKCVEDLVKEGYILLHKGGEAISLNPAKSKEIIEFVKSVLE